MIGEQPMCLGCKHLHPTTNGPMGTPTTCDAFPKKIPDDIYRYARRHDRPYPGDNGIRFEPIEAKQPA